MAKISMMLQKFMFGQTMEWLDKCQFDNSKK